MRRKFSRRMKIPDMDQRSSVRNDRCRATVTRHISAKDGGELALKAFRFHAITSLTRRLGESRMREVNLKRYQVGKVRSELLNETRVRLRSGEIREIPLSIVNIPWSSG